MKTPVDTKQTIESLSHQWRLDDRELIEFFNQFRQWAYEIAQRGFPHFGETADRLRQLRHQLVEHFAHEDEICRRLVQISGALSPEVDANCRQVACDHERLLSRLDALVAQLSDLEPPFDSWQAAVEQVERLCDAIEQHEEQESDCIGWLLPNEG